MQQSRDQVQQVPYCIKELHCKQWQWLWMGAENRSKVIRERSVLWYSYSCMQYTRKKKSIKNSDENNAHLLFFLGFWPSGQPLLEGHLLVPLESPHAARMDQPYSVSPVAWSKCLAGWSTQIPNGIGKSLIKTGLSLWLLKCEMGKITNFMKSFTTSSVFESLISWG